MPKTEDFYDRAVAYFREHPEEIHEAWNYPADRHFGALFGILGGDRFYMPRSTSDCGCPSQVKSGFAAATPELTALTRAMKLPKCKPFDTTPKITSVNLPAFARAQRLADKMLNRPEPQEDA